MEGPIPVWRYKFIALFLSLTIFASCDFTLFETTKGTGLSTSQSVSADTPRVILFVIDGPRRSEFFDDPTHQYIPRIWSELRPLGTIYENFRNNGVTRTSAGHAQLLTGTRQDIDGDDPPTRPTIFEYYRKATGAPIEDCHLIANKLKLTPLTHSNYPGYGADYRASLNVGYPYDTDVEQELMTTLQNDQPHLVMVSFAQVDTKGHSGFWDQYLTQIGIVDNMAANLWQWLQSDPYYSGNTYMFITSDHGRHTDEHGGFQHHGDNCEGCRRIPFLVLGPDIRQGHTVAAHTSYSQNDLVPTLAAILGVDAPHASGVLLDDMFTWNVPTGIK